MPKITAATVAEHRVAQHRAVLDAGSRLIEQTDGQVPTLAEVAQQVGLARSSLYQYVKSGTDLIVQLLLQVIPEWTGALRAEMTAAGDDPADQIAVYLESTFRLFADGVHGPLMIAAATVPEAFADPRVQAAHTALAPVLDELLRAAGGEQAVTGLPLLESAIQRGGDLVAHGRADRAVVLAALHRMADGLLRPVPETVPPDGSA